MNDYPQFRARSMTIGTIEERVNGCMTRSMGHGTPLPPDSREMLGMVAYSTQLVTLQAWDLPDEQRERTIERLRKARGLVGSTDALERFDAWSAPEER